MIPIIVVIGLTIGGAWLIEGLALITISIVAILRGWFGRDPLAPRE